MKPTPSPSPENEKVLWLREPADVLNELDLIKKHRLNGKFTVSFSLMQELAMFVRTAIQNRLPLQFGDIFLEMGKLTLVVLGDQFQDEAFVQLLLGKHKRYGVDALLGWAEIGICMRIDSKIDRAANMIAEPGLEKDTDESVKDSMIDIVGYCVLGIIMARKRKDHMAQAKIIIPQGHGPGPGPNQSFRFPGGMK